MGSTTETELRSVGGGARRSIAWDDLDAAALGARGRAVVGASWRERMKQEHLAVGAFALLARELAEVGCDLVVLSLLTRASSDEVRHAEICRRFAVALMGEDEVPSRVRGLPKVPMHDEASAEERALFHVVEMCCLSETLTGVFLTEMLAVTTDSVARIAIESLLEDEIDHGRVGWAYLAERAAEGRTTGLSAALPRMLDRTFHAVFDAASRAKPDDAKLERCGFLGMHASARIYARTLQDVILPGFEQLGIDVAASRKRIHGRGWLRPPRVWPSGTTMTQ
jgi:hypothetical protein